MIDLERIAMLRAEEQYERLSLDSEPPDRRRLPKPRNPCGGGAPRGEANGKTRRFTPETVREIRARRSEGETLVSIARAYGITDGMVSRITSGRAYGWVR